MSQPTNDDRTTALGLFNYARSYRSSADHLLAAKLKVTHPSAPMTFLFYHATELYLKAYLRSQNLSVAQLKKIGHDIQALSAAATAAGLSLDDEDKEVMTAISQDDNVIRSRYIQTGAFSMPEENALSRTCASLDQKIGVALSSTGISIRPDTKIPPPISSDALGEIEDDLSTLTKKEREIIAYLLHRNQRMFTADLDGGHAATLMSRGIVRKALRPGQVFDISDVPMEIPQPIWKLQGESRSVSLRRRRRRSIPVARRLVRAITLAPISFLHWPIIVPRRTSKTNPSPATPRNKMPRKMRCILKQQPRL